MEADEQRKTGESVSLSQILLSTDNPFVSSSKIKSSSEESSKRPVGPSSKYEFVRIVADHPEENRRHKRTKRVEDVGSNRKREVPSSPAMEKAKELEASLSHEYPIFIKAMTPSDVTHHFYMLFTRQFSKSYLPNEETLVVLEDEKGKQYKTKYLPKWASLSAGWRHFTIAKSLRVEDVLVFHLVQPCKFKVYILRPDDFDPVDKDLSISKPKEIHLKKKRACGKKPKANPTRVETKIPKEDLEANTKTISSPRNLKIIVDKNTKDSEIPKQIAKNGNLVKGINRKLATSIISETNIENAIKNSEMSTLREDIVYWNTALQSFEFLGMDVGFIRTRLDRLLGIALECSNTITNFKKNRNIDNESVVARIEEEIREYENKIEELKILKKKVEMRKNESMEEIVKRFKVMYKEEAKAPW